MLLASINNNQASIRVNHKLAFKTAKAKALLLASKLMPTFKHRVQLQTHRQHRTLQLLLQPQKLLRPNSQMNRASLG